MNLSRAPDDRSLPKPSVRRNFKQNSKPHGSTTAKQGHAAGKTAFKSLCAIVVGSMAGTIAFWTTLYFVVLPVQNSEIQPTAIPWLDNEADCQTTGRVWQNGDCWDYQHSPDF